MHGQRIVIETAYGVSIQPREQRVILDTARLIEMVRTECERYGEVSAVDFGDPEEFDAFMDDLYSQCEYYPAGFNDKHLFDAINLFLDNFENEYLRHPFTTMQRYYWFLLAKDIVSQTFEFGLRDTCLISRFVYDRMMGGSVVLKEYGQ